MTSPRLLVVLPIAATLLSACVVAPYPHRAVYAQPVPVGARPVPYYDADEAVVDIAPPAPYVEVVPAIPFAGAVWIGGYWGWRWPACVGRWALGTAAPRLRLAPARVGAAGRPLASARGRLGERLGSQQISRASPRTPLRSC